MIRYFTFSIMLITLALTITAHAEEPFLQPPQVIDLPSPPHAATMRAFQGIPSLAIAPNGRLWATWYAGKTAAEDRNNYVVLATSGDDGATWSEVRVVDPDGDGPVRAYDPELWVDPTGRLWSFWAQTVGHTGTVAGVWCSVTENPGDAKPTWSAPKRLTDGIMMCKPTVLSTGEWILPASTWRETDDSARLIVSRDKGETWILEGACNIPKDVRVFDEHVIVERKDGSLWMLVRVSYGIGESVSTDRGKTWSPLTPSGIEHPSARFFVRRLASGNLLLVKHGPIKERTGRSHLTAYVSKDDGKTWEGGLLLDERKGVSYPDGQQGKDGVVRIIYDYSRTNEREILMAKFTEDDVLKGDANSKTVSLRNVVDKASMENYHVHAHAHNDYEHERPLLDALDNQFYSVEADFWFLDGEILVAHDKQKDRSGYKGTLKELYLDPLQKRVDEKGSVHGDGVPFLLWLDIKDGRDEVRPVLHKLLSQYSMLTVFTDDEIKEGSVTVILTGNAKSKRAYAKEFETRYACRDSNDYSSDDPQADNDWRWFALNWKSYIKWYGDEPIRPEEREKWIHIVNDIHAKGRKVRFWNAPETELFWKTALEVGCDLINTDKLEELNALLEKQ